MERYKTFKDFYPYYIEEHSKPKTKLLHFIGTSISLFFLVQLARTFDPIYLIYALLSGYGFAWICLLYTSPSPRDAHESRMPSSA